jgi:hypothetical protein
MKKIYLLCLLYSLPLNSMAMNEQNWQLVLGEDPQSDQTTCLMVSAVNQTEDGQGRTNVSLVYNGKVFIARTESNIDLSYPGVGLQVDHQLPHAIDRLHKKNSVLFEAEAGEIHEEFIQGLTGKLTLGFWPSWPKTRAYVTEFDLRGFTKNYEAFLRCQQTGELP